MSKVKLKRLKINKYRNVRPGTELHFDDGVNLVLGQNGSGKTTLLGLIAAVAGSDFSRLQDEAFELEYNLSDGNSSGAIHVRYSGNQQSNTTFSEATQDRRRNQVINGSEHDKPLERDSLSLATEHRSPHFTYEAMLTTGSTPHIYEVKGTPEATTVSIRNDVIPQTLVVQPFPPSQRDFLLNALFEASRLPQLKPAVNTALNLHPYGVFRFDESLDTFLAMTGRKPALPLASTPLVSDFRVAVPRGGLSYASYRRCVFTPSNLAPAIFRAHGSPAGELRLRARDDLSEPSLAFLQNAALTIGFQNAALRPEIKVVQNILNESHEYFEGLGFSFNFTRNDGTTIHHDLLSYGQKRLLAFFYYLAATDDIVIADELVNGLHHRWIEACMNAISERQAFLTSQNPLLFDYVEFDSIEQVQARFITCKTEIVEGTDQLVWQNMPRDDAERFYRGYEADIESIGDILINRGLW